MYFKELSEWRDNPELNDESDFMKRVFQEDIIPCLNFNDKLKSKDLFESIQQNCVCIEDLKNSQSIEK